MTLSEKFRILFSIVLRDLETIKYHLLLALLPIAIIVAACISFEAYIITLGCALAGIILFGIGMCGYFLYNYFKNIWTSLK